VLHLENLIKIYIKKYLLGKNKFEHKFSHIGGVFICLVYNSIIAGKLFSLLEKENLKSISTYVLIHNMIFYFYDTKS